MTPFIDYQRFIDSAIRPAKPAQSMGVKCDLTPDRIHGQLQLARKFIGHETRATVGLCSLLHDDPDQMTLVTIIICDSENIPPVISPMVMPRSFPNHVITPGELFVRALVRAWKEVIERFDESVISRQYMLGFLAHCCLVWPEDGGDVVEGLPLSEDGLAFVELAERAFK